MKRYILFAIVATVLSAGMQLKAENVEKEERNPDRTEKKSFSDIGDVEIDHKYGNIVVRESNTKNVELEVQYFDNNNAKATCEIKMNGSTLEIRTLNSTTSGMGIAGIKVKTSNSGKDLKINYILSLPKNVSLITTLKYGNMNISKVRGEFEADLSYGNLDVEDFGNITPKLNLRYGNLTIGEVQELDLSVSYSNVTIRKAKIFDFEGAYNNFILGKIGSMDISSESRYNKFEISEVGTINCEIKYGNLTIGNLASSIDLVAAYSNVSIATSAKAKSVEIEGAYSDITIQLPSGISASFESEIKHGDLIISNTHKATYTEHSVKNFTSSKSGKIGTKSPALNMNLSNRYSDIKIK
ncbi:DUF4097 family beta strand repeat-containing protein [Dysgonomonas sp. 25]|uniref:DUF4097 family beta strand repeat-containing protein n=1 Tax=Dysgonomonas sp. 25 TaxID=2302933 RepID=UPI0013D88CFF|nr:DUF4097 family beta strand repeat-containing protein [Dysgonomonas sp. 25]NDV70284.1 hypothetical protein [Dysgonomonas sp. 25]